MACVAVVSAFGLALSYEALKAALDHGVARPGRLDIVAANAGIHSLGRADELTEQAWQDVIDVNLTGTWHTVEAAIPHLRQPSARVGWSAAWSNMPAVKTGLARATASVARRGHEA